MCQCYPKLATESVAYVNLDASYIIVNCLLFHIFYLLNGIRHLMFGNRQLSFGVVFGIWYLLFSIEHLASGI